MSDDADNAGRAEEAERQNGVSVDSKALQRQGRDHCLDCGDKILEARRAAVPSAKRCAFCQTRFEGGGH
jgi:RNA polymerase-binding transcription factor DksA